MRVAPVVTATLSAVYATSATLRAERRVTVPTRARGVVVALEVEEGQAVARDAVLARLDDEEQAIELTRARAVLAAEEREHERAVGLHGRRALSDNELEVARRELDEARHRHALAQLALDRTAIRAPFAGRVVVRHAELGQALADGAPVVDVARTDLLEADVGVPERHVARLRVGQAVRLAADATGEAHEARVLRIAPVVDPETGTVKVTLAVTGGADLRPGAFVRAAIVVEARPGALVVPRSALVAQGTGWELFRLAPDGRSVEALAVETGLEEGDLVEVAVASGLAPGDLVVVAGAVALAQGARVTVEGPGLE